MVLRYPRQSSLVFFQPIISVVGPVGVDLNALRLWS
jgi:hypothetical protein